MCERHNIVEIALHLIFVQRAGIEPARSEGGKLRLLTGTIWDLELGDRGSRYEAELCRIVYGVGRVAEKPALPRSIVDRLMAGRRVFDAKAVHGQPACGEGLPRPILCPVFEGRLTGFMAAAIETDAAAGHCRGSARYDVDEAGSMQPVLGGQCASDQRHGADEAGLHDLGETRNAIRQQNPVYTILDVAVLIADMKIAAGGENPALRRELEEVSCRASFGHPAGESRSPRD